MKKANALFLALTLLLLPWNALAQQRTSLTAPAPDVIGSQCALLGQFASCSPAQLGVNALTEPGSGTTALSSIIDTRGAKQATLNVNCTQGTITLNVQTYAEDGATTLALIAPITGAAAAANIQLVIGSESNPASNTVAPTANIIIRLPQRALAFSFTNASVTAGTCTARLFLSY